MATYRVTILRSEAKKSLPYRLYDPAWEGLDVEFESVTAGKPEDALLAVNGADVVMSAGVPVDATLIAAMDRAQSIAIFGHGFESVDVNAATRAGIMVTNAAYICNQEVANHCAAMILALNRKLVQADRAMRDGIWDRPSLRPIGPLDGEVAGLIGFGAIGRSLARRLNAFGLSVHAYDPYTDEWAWREYGVTRSSSLEKLLALSDYVSIQVPFNDQTHHMIGESQFRVMKKTAYFVNCCRGGVVDEAALIKVLKQNLIAGAGLDVFEQEPTPPDNPLLSMDNVIATPHAGGESTASGHDSNRVASEQAAAVLRGQWPSRLVNPEVRLTLRAPR